METLGKLSTLGSQPRRSQRQQIKVLKDVVQERKKRTQKRKSSDCDHKHNKNIKKNSEIEKVEPMEEDRGEYVVEKIIGKRARAEELSLT